jgi:hypothetical protein
MAVFKTVEEDGTITEFSVSKSMMSSTTTYQLDLLVLQFNSASSRSEKADIKRRYGELADKLNRDLGRQVWNKTF